MHEMTSVSINHSRFKYAYVTLIVTVYDVFNSIFRPRQRYVRIVLWCNSRIIEFDPICWVGPNEGEKWINNSHWCSALND